MTVVVRTRGTDKMIEVADRCEKVLTGLEEALKTKELDND